MDTVCNPSFMAYRFEDLPHWEFTVREVSAGVYRLQAAREGGITSVGTGTDVDALLEEYRTWASNVERDVTDRTSKSQ